MTSNEAIQIVKDAMKALLGTMPKVFDEHVNDFVFTDHDAIERILTANNMACKAINLADKYTWHRYNGPDDLPDRVEMVEVCENCAGDIRYGHNTVIELPDGSRAWAITGDYPVWHITHWRYIEPVEENEWK